MTDLCECSRPTHYDGHHYPDTSQPGMNTTWCMCGGLGNFHHTSISEESPRIAPEARELETTGAHDFGDVGRDA